MSKFWLCLVVALYLCECGLSKWSPEQVCGKSSSKTRTLKLYANSRRNESTEWLDTFTALAESSDSSTRMEVDLTHTVFECNSKRSIFIRGDTNATVPAVVDDRLYFHSRCGKNAAIMEDGRVAQKINNDDAFNSQLFTKRPLRNGEIFEIKLEKKNTKFNYCLGIGIITRTAETVDILAEMHKSPVTWIYHHGNIYSNGAAVLANYGKDINKLQVGERVGVMRSEFGTVHFFVNGVDQGPAVSNIPSPVYGIVELWYNAMKVSIVDPSASN